MKKILLFTLFFLSLFWISQTFADYGPITDIWYSVEFSNDAFYVVSAEWDKTNYNYYLKLIDWNYIPFTIENVKIHYPYVDSWYINFSTGSNSTTIYMQNSDSFVWFSPQIWDIYYFYEWWWSWWETINTWSLSSSINAVSTNTSTESSDILTWPTGILIGSLLWLIVVVIIVRRLYLIYRN